MSDDDYRIALRPDHEDPELLDDVVIHGVSLFRAEMMSDTVLWMQCYLHGTGEHVTFHIQATRRKGKRLALEFTATEQPPERDGITYEDGN